MALGKGCIYKNSCKQFGRETFYYKCDYCDNDLNWRNCKHIPGYRPPQQNNGNNGNNGNSKGGSLGALIVVGIIIYFLWKHFA